MKQICVSSAWPPLDAEHEAQRLFAMPSARAASRRYGGMLPPFREAAGREGRRPGGDTPRLGGKDGSGRAGGQDARCARGIAGDVGSGHAVELQLPRQPPHLPPSCCLRRPPGSPVSEERRAFLTFEPDSELGSAGACICWCRRPQPRPPRARAQQAQLMPRPCRPAGQPIATGPQQLLPQDVPGPAESMRDTSGAGAGLPGKQKATASGMSTVTRAWTTVPAAPVLIRVQTVGWDRDTKRTCSSPGGHGSGFAGNARGFGEVR